MYRFSSLIAQSHAALRPLSAHELTRRSTPTVTSWAIDWKPPRIYSMAPFTAIHGTNTRDRQQYDRSSLRRTSISRQRDDLSVADSYWKCHGVFPNSPMQLAGERSLYSAVTATRKVIMQQISNFSKSHQQACRKKEPIVRSGGSLRETMLCRTRREESVA
jgi:hypothetical protein